MSPVIDTIMKHRSIRSFMSDAIEPEQLDQIINCGIAASSSSLLQAVSVIRVCDKEKRKLLAQYAGNQAYVESGHGVIHASTPDEQFDHFINHWLQVAIWCDSFIDNTSLHT